MKARRPRRKRSELEDLQESYSGDVKLNLTHVDLNLTHATALIQELQERGVELDPELLAKRERLLAQADKLRTKFHAHTTLTRRSPAAR